MNTTRERPTKPQRSRWTQVALRVPPDLAEEFARVAASEDRTVSAALRRLMRRHVDAASGKEAPTST
jgi:hypothetical protein